MREEMPRTGHRNAGEKAGLGQGEVRHVPRLSAPLSEVCHSVRQQDKEARTIYQSECEGVRPDFPDKINSYGGPVGYRDP